MLLVEKLCSANSGIGSFMLVCGVGLGKYLTVLTEFVYLATAVYTLINIHISCLLVCIFVHSAL